MPDWGIAIISIAVGTLLGFGLNLLREKQQEKRKRSQEALEKHFEDIEREIIEKILQMARSLTIRNNRLVFGSYAPVSESYNFEKQISYECFQLHFPEEAKEWKKLNNQAVELNEKVVDFFQRHSYHHGTSAQNIANKYIENLQQGFSNFAQRLTSKVESIDKYEMGKKFKKQRNCPVCKKF